MTTKCEICGSATADAFLCRSHVSELAATLTDLAHGAVVNGKPTEGLLANLQDEVLKMVRKGGSSGHRKKGDELPVPFIPHTGKMLKDKRTGEETPVPSVQGRASDLLDAARNTLTTIIRDLCESRGVEPPDGRNRPFPEMATWLAGHVHAMALDESAGRWWFEIDSLKRSIERVIDRPTKIELLGFCITQTSDRKTCDTALRAPEDVIEVQCRKCRAVRRCDTVRAQGQSDAKRALIPWAKVLETNKAQPDGWRVNERTLRDWRSTGALRPREYLRPDGTHVINRHGEDDVQLFKWNDVEQLRTHGVKRGGRKRTRAGA